MRAGVRESRGGSARCPATLLDEYDLDSSSVTTAEKRILVRRFSAMQAGDVQQGVLREWLARFKPGLANFTEDVLNESLLETYRRP